MKCERCNKKIWFWQKWIRTNRKTVYHTWCLFTELYLEAEVRLENEEEEEDKNGR